MAMKPTFHDCTLQDVLLGYVKIKEPGIRYGMSANSFDKFEGDQFEYGVQLYLTKAEAAKLKKSAPKMKKKLTPVEADEVKERLKLDEDVELDEAMYYRINIAQPFVKKNQKGEVYNTKQPRIFARTSGGKQEITNSTLVANGSIANVKLGIMTYESPIDGKETQKLLLGQPACLFVTNLIEYKKTGAAVSNDDDLFGDAGGDIIEEDASVEKPSTEAIKEVRKDDKTVDVDTDFDEPPFDLDEDF